MYKRWAPRDFVDRLENRKPSATVGKRTPISRFSIPASCPHIGLCQQMFLQEFRYILCIQDRIHFKLRVTSFLRNFRNEFHVGKRRSYTLRFVDKS